MSSVLISLFGVGKDLSILQMSNRGIVVFLLALLLIRIAGRRSFGLRTPLDNIITILLGAILSRGVVGASEFLPTIITCLVIVILHRIIGTLIASSPRLSRIIEGNKVALYENGHFNRKKMRSMQVAEEDALQGMRKGALTENLKEIDKIYIERNGEISAVRKEH